jgi:serine/threonine protein kinase
MAKSIGQEIGKYKLIDLIGSGGYADVYLGEHLDTHRLVAIKKMNHTPLTERDRELFLKEARIISRLEHKHIVKIEHYGVDEEGIPFLIMQYARQGTPRYPEGTRLPLSTVALYVQHIAEALQYAHDNGVVHCDVKPENILLAAQDDVLLSDFGIAVIIESSLPFSQRTTLNQNIIGTVKYMAPERFDGKPCAASDQYALGIVVYQWLCGKLPFTGSIPQIMAHHLHSSPPSLRQHNSAIPAEVEAVVLRTLSKDPLQRFSSLAEFNAAFQHAARLSQHATVPLTSPLPLSPLTRKHLVLSLSLSSLLTVLLTLLLLFFAVRTPLAFLFSPPLTALPGRTALPDNCTLFQPVSSQPAHVIKIGVDLPLSGLDAADGQPVLNAIKLALTNPALNKVSDARYSYTVEVYACNDVSSITQKHESQIGAQDINVLAGDPQVAAIIGPFNSDVAITEIPAADQHGLLLISPSTTSTCLTARKPDPLFQCPGTYQPPNPTSAHRTIFYRTAALDSTEGEYLATYLIKQHLSTHAYIIEDSNSVYGEDLGYFFGRDWPAGETSVSRLPSTSSPKDYQSALDSFPLTDPQHSVIFYAGNMPNAALIYNLIEQDSHLSGVTFAAGGGIINTNFTRSISLEGVQTHGPLYAVAPVGRNTSSSASFDSFSDNYIATYGDLPTPYSASAYDCVQMIIQAINKALQTSSPTRPDGTFRTAVIRALADLPPLDQGITDSYRFNESGDTCDQSVSLYSLDSTQQGQQDWQNIDSQDQRIC